MDGETQVVGLATNHEIKRINGRIELQEITRSAAVPRHILPVAAREQKGIIAGPSDEHVVPEPTTERIVAAAPAQRIIRAVADERIIKPLPIPLIAPVPVSVRFSTLAPSVRVMLV